MINSHDKRNVKKTALFTLAIWLIGTMSSMVSLSVAIAAGPPSVAFIPIPIDDEFVVIPVGVNLPPDPGAAGKTTIEGVDTDKDGVRDDIARAIVFAFPSNQQARTVLFDMAKHYQSVIVNRASASAVLDGFGSLAGLTPCLQGATADMDITSAVLRPWTLNTYDRSTAYLTALNTIAGMEVPSKAATCP